MSNRHDEDLLCMAFNAHLDIYFPQQPGILVYTHIANQGRSAGQGDKLKKMGVNAGWFDYIFINHPSRFSAICLEAKVHGRNYSDSQKTFDYLTKGMPVFKGKFYSVKEGHNLLLEAGVKPFSGCSLFKEPDVRSDMQKGHDAFEFYRP